MKNKTPEQVGKMEWVRWVKVSERNPTTKHSETFTCIEWLITEVDTKNKELEKIYKK